MSSSMAGIAEDKCEAPSFANGGGFDRPRSLPRPPSSPVFAPEINLSMTLGLSNAGEPKLDRPKQSTFCFPSAIAESNQNVPEEFRLLARPLSAKSDGSSLGSDDDFDYLQPGETIINFDDDFDQPDKSPLLAEESVAIAPAETGPSPIRQSILCLRRMNSDARHDSTKPGLFATKRYLMMDGGQEKGRCDSWISLASANSKAPSSNMLSQGLGDHFSPVWLNPIEALAVIPAGHPSLNVNRAGSAYGQSRLLPPVNAVIWEDQAAKTGPDTQTPFRMKLVPPSGEPTPCATPMSLYDENGFLAEFR